MMQIGIDSFVETVTGTNRPEGELGVQRVRELLEEVELADRVGLDVYGIGEHHREEYIASSPAILLAAAAARTKNIRLTSAVTVLSSDDPVRVFQDFATVDLISAGRAEIVVGRGSFIESYPLFGYDLQHYDELFAEKLDLLLKLREETRVQWEGKHRPSLTGQGVWPRPAQDVLPIRLGVGGTPASFVRAGILGLPLTVAIIGGEPHRFRPMIDLYRQAGLRAGHAPETLDVAIHGIGFVADTTEQAADDLWPYLSMAFTRIGRERGWPPTTRAAYDAQRSEQGAYFIGDPETVAKKMRYVDEVLGGVSRITLMLSGGPLPHAKMLRTIEMLGTQVRPLVNG
ncbi:LLM class flavin-dependent oxidoreductase [Granulicella mallensis]|uniref:Putative oxidoreductase, LLM family n=1 Tax=Granulicella mallensis (strain ATCC BAA-1857 / DSM 23137 / MP5ACTX8) TaxID=682795 RepID=G8NXT3_GRAMM|nr:LLM class flavin-dependent oxidoreductase [Granulicella mallensis]AEU34428.1 putative oxidoreductase, LLM family [Granulicella mallensis MP5ACTX8]